jgi:hypothetical protein
MKKYALLVCLISIVGCSKSEAILSVPSMTEEVSHISNYDLNLVDGLIQLKISKEEAIKRGVPASEYDLVEETLIKHNSGKVQTKAMNNNTLAWGILEYPTNADHSNSAGPFFVSQSLYGGGICLSYSMGTGNEGSNYLTYHLYDSPSSDPIYDCAYSYGFSQEVIPFPSFDSGSITLDYSYDGPYTGICIYEIYSY